MTCDQNINKTNLFLDWGMDIMPHIYIHDCIEKEGLIPQAPGRLTSFDFRKSNCGPTTCKQLQRYLVLSLLWLALGNAIVAALQQ